MSLVNLGCLLESQNRVWIVMEVEECCSPEVFRLIVIL
jgi:hypothetical protein